MAFQMLLDCKSHRSLPPSLLIKDDGSCSLRHLESQIFPIYDIQITPTICAGSLSFPLLSFFGAGEKKEKWVKRTGGKLQVEEDHL